MATTNYVVIDQVGVIGQYMDNTKKKEDPYGVSRNAIMAKAWDKVNARIAEENRMNKGVEGFVPPTKLTMKKLCKTISPYAKEVTQDMKTYVRYNKHPKKVYILCDTYNSKVKFVEKQWHNNGVFTEVIEMEERTLHISSKEGSKYRECANTWAAALGWRFDAPLYRDENEVRSVEDYVIGNKQFRQDLQASNPDVKLTKITQDAKKTQVKFAEVASEEECIKFFNYYSWIKDNGLLNDYLDTGYKLCPHCGMPIKVAEKAYLSKRERTCSHCEKEINAEYLNRLEYFNDNSDTTLYEDAEVLSYYDSLYKDEYEESMDILDTFDETEFEREQLEAYEEETQILDF